MIPENRNSIADIVLFIGLLPSRCDTPLCLYIDLTTLRQPFKNMTVYPSVPIFPHTKQDINPQEPPLPSQ